MSENEPLKGKVAIVTGAARGIGRAYALRLAKLGADVVIADRDLQGAAIYGERLGAESVPGEIEALGRRSIGVEGDLSKPDDVKRLFDETMKVFGRVDILVNNAGGAIGREPAALPSNTSQEDYDLLMDANFRTAVLCCQAAAPIMKAQESGIIVNIAAQTGAAPLPSAVVSIYGSARAAVAMYTRNLAAELGPHGIRVNAISPGITMTARIAQQAAERGIGTNSQVEALPLRRFAEPEDMAGVLEFLTTDLSQYVTGQVISVCGGALLTAS